MKKEKVAARLLAWLPIGEKNLGNQKMRIADRGKGCFWGGGTRVGKNSWGVVVRQKKEKTVTIRSMYKGQKKKVTGPLDLSGYKSTMYLGGGGEKPRIACRR